MVPVAVDIRRIHEFDGQMYTCVNKHSKSHYTEDQSQGVLREPSYANCHHWMLIHINGNAWRAHWMMFLNSLLHVNFSFLLFGDECMTSVLLSFRPFWHLTTFATRTSPTKGKRKKKQDFLNLNLNAKCMSLANYRDEYAMCAVVRHILCWCTHDLLFNWTVRDDIVVCNSRLHVAHDCG